MKLGKYDYGTPNKLQIQVDEFAKGTNKIQSDTRIDKEEAAESTNLMLKDDGLWSPRWGTKTYGGAIAGADRIDGFAEYVTSTGSRELIVVANGVVQKKNGSSWTTITGATFTEGEDAYMKQLKGLLYISNSTDDMAVYDGTDLTTYNALVAPTTLALDARGAGLTTGDYNMYFVVTALNDIGETGASNELTFTVDIERDAWDSTNDEYIDLTWDAVADATRYSIYMSDESGYEKFLDNTETNSYTDDGSAIVNPYAEYPDDDTTAGPKSGPLTFSGNRLWSTKDEDHPQRVYFTGTGPELGAFSPFYGGGFIDLEKGGRSYTEVVVDYRDGEGNPRATVICSTPEGTGTVWQVSITSITVETTNFSIPSASKVTGSTGTNAPKSVVLAKDDVYFLNKRGVDVLGNEKQFWGILRTKELSVKIRPYITDSVSAAKMDDACAYYYDDKIFFSASTDGVKNNRMFYYDREHRVFVADWSVGVTQFGEYTDSSGITHFLGGSPTDGYLVEFGEGTLGDRGVAFSTKYRGPRFSMGTNWSKFAKLRKFNIRMIEPKGLINLSILGTGKRAGFSSLKTASITTTSALTGMGLDKMGTIKLGDTSGTPETFASKNAQRNLRLNNKVRDVQLEVATSGINASYKLQGYRVEATVSAQKDPSTERL